MTAQHQSRRPDAPSIVELDLVKWSISIARKVSVPKKKVLTAMSLD
jgi:hypothetical protein